MSIKDALKATKTETNEKKLNLKRHKRRMYQKWTIQTTY